MDKKSLGQLLWHETFTLFNLVNLVLAALIIWTGSGKNALFLNLVIWNWAIGIFQQVRSRRILDRLELLHQNRYAKWEDGKETPILLDQIQKGDILVLVQGDQVPCDGPVLSGQAELNESLLTGESEEIPKRPGDQVSAGTTLLSGRIHVQVDKAPSETRLKEMEREAARNRQYPSRLRDGIQAIIRLSTFILIPAGILLFVRALLDGSSLDEAILSTAAALIGLIPEGLVMLTTIALSLSAIRLAREEVLVQELYCAENLARTDILCTDKTGTLTTGHMELRQIVPVSLTETEARQTLARFYGSMPDANATANAMKAALPKDQFPDVQDVRTFSSKTKYASVKTEGKEIAVGAWGFLPGTQGQPVPPIIQDYAGRGFRVLALTIDQKLAALALLQDPLKPDAKKTLDYFRSQGVRVVVLSGDDPATVQAIANEAGIQGSAETLDENDLPAQLERCSIFGRVTPDQKKQVVTLLQKEGHSVTMTGDGVNDVPALKAADCSVAMGSGSQAARTVSSLVLLDDQFERMPDILLQGRRVINNITRTASLFLVKTLFSFGLTLLTLFFLKQYPFQPIQLTLVSMVSSGIPGFLLTFEPSWKRVEGDFLKTVLTNALPGALTLVLCIGAAALLERWIPATEEQFSTLCTMLAGINSLFVLAYVCQPMTKGRSLILLLCIAVFAGSVLFLPRLYSLTPLNGMQTGELAVLAALIPFLQFRKRKTASAQTGQTPPHMR